MNREQGEARIKSLQADANAAYQDMVAGKITEKKFNSVMDRAEAERDHIDAQMQSREKAIRYGDTGASSSAAFHQFSGGVVAKGVKQQNVSPLDMPAGELQNMFEAVKRKMPYRCEIHNKGFAASAGFKTTGAPITEGAQWPSGLFPPQLRPELTQELRYDYRLADFLPTITIDAPSIEYLVHTGNANPAAVVQELGVKPDIGIQLTTETAVPVKLAALASISMEAAQDMSYFMDFVPRELQRAVIDVETQQLVLGTGINQMLGFIGTSGVLTRSYDMMHDISQIDTLVQAFDDLRVGSAKCDPNLLIMHPKTWGYIKRIKTTTDAFVLSVMDPNSIGSLDNVFGVKTITHTSIPEGTAIAMNTDLACKYFVRSGLTIDTNYWGDTEWQTNAISFRCEMRSVLAVTRPAAVCIVVGLSDDGS